MGALWNFQLAFAANEISYYFKDQQHFPIYQAYYTESPNLCVVLKYQDTL